MSALTMCMASTAVSAEPAGIPNTPPVANSEEKSRILLVDDRPENLITLRAVLDELDQEIVTATSGADALRRVLAGDFAVILLDVTMPEMDGFETAALIRGRDRSRHTPIIFLTAVSRSEGSRLRGYSVGAVDYVLKPFEPDVLRAKVQAFVELDLMAKRLHREAERRRIAEEQVRELNEGLERRVAERTAALEKANRELRKEIAERKRTESTLAQSQRELAAVNERLQRAMTETHHRVKNNLQLIAAMLDLRLGDGAETVTADEVRSLGRYVRTLAAVHDVLTKHAKADGAAYEVSSREVLQSLLCMLQETAPGGRVTYTVDDARISARAVTSLALVTNELVSNAIKYGRGDVRVAFRITPSSASLEVADNGPGFPPDFDPAQSANTGLELVENLSRWDLHGRADYFTSPEGGGCVRVQMPLVFDSAAEAVRFEPSGAHAGASQS